MGTWRETGMEREREMGTTMGAIGRPAAAVADSGEATRATGRTLEWPSRY
jgi:hypothetical protein